MCDRIGVQIVNSLGWRQAHEIKPVIIQLSLDLIEFDTHHGWTLVNFATPNFLQHKVEAVVLFVHILHVNKVVCHGKD